MHLARLVNYGHSYEGAEDIFDLLLRYPLSHTYVHLYKPKRKYLPFPKPRNADAGLSHFHLIEFNSEEGAATGKYHSHLGTETKLKGHPTEGLKAVKRAGRKKKGESVCHIMNIQIIQIFYCTFPLLTGLVPRFHSSISNQS